jgi:hypothetical protein
MKFLHRLFKRCYSVEMIEELHSFHGLNSNSLIARCQVDSRVRERNALWRVRCHDCGRVFMRRYLIIVPEP